jgi:uncharacterized protein (TIGR02453 family)
MLQASDTLTDPPPMGDARRMSYFDADALRFLSELRTHNDRAWFVANKERYEKKVRDPMLRFIADLGPRLKKISPHFVCDPKPVGGSMFRIYRDTRFAKDKSPYKTHIAAHFWHGKAKGETTPGFFLRIEPGASIFGAGLWHPEPPALKRIRDRIVADGKGWQRVTSGRELRGACGMAGESLKRPPQGYDPLHPFIEDLKRKDFAMSGKIADRDISSKALMDTVVESYQTTAPFLAFLTKAVGLPF